MGPHFNFTSWCDSWLLTSGTNFIHPIIEYTEDKKVKSFSINQTFNEFGQNQLRRQKLDIAFFDASYNQHTLKSVILSDSQNMNHINISSLEPISYKAIVMNYGDYAYDVVFYDENTLSNLENDLYMIKDYLTRMMVW